jgi:hypothetical protein
MSNVIYHDFTPKPKDENLIELILDSGDVLLFSLQNQTES